MTCTFLLPGPSLFRTYQIILLDREMILTPELYSLNNLSELTAVKCTFSRFQISEEEEEKKS